ncbi:serine hydrolase [candidate division KSB1 bacterium]|nr:serine hydrolase [candidate division KSB1 bacterium]
MRCMLSMLTAVSLLACDRAPRESPSVRFEHDLEALKEYFHIPGMAAIVTQRGDVIYENYFGYADLQTERRVDSTTIFPIASITKTFAAVLLMQLVESGDLDLDEPINNYLADSDLSDSITIRHVLSHTSEGKPGSFFNYSGRFSRLTEVLETVTGKPLEVLLQDNILEPQGLGNTLSIVSQANVDSLTDVLAKPYEYYGTIEDGHFDIGLTSSFGLASTARDLAKFDKALGSGALISDKNRSEMFSPFRTSTGISPYGLGIFSQVFLGKQIIWGYGQEENFSGLPVPVMAATLATYVIFSYDLWEGMRFAPFLIPLVLFLCYLMVSHVEYEMMPKFSFREGKRNSILIIIMLLAIAAVVIFRQKATFPMAMGFVLFFWIRSLVHHHEEEENEELLDVSIPD